ncbi:MAG TPA: M1 family metallopeptidase [Dongiaceae bacterium]|nr:M1 family metallopeptidase [Dongiaceae bacterium]
MKLFSLTFGVLIWASKVLAVEPAADPLRLDPLVEPIAQALELALDPAAERYTGSTRIELQFHVATNQFRFHAKSMELRRATLDGRELALKASEADLVIATAPEPFASGPHNLQIDFASAFDRSGAGLYKSVYEGRSYLFTKMEPIDARRAFPCWDEPGFKIPWRLTVTIPSGLEAVANMPMAQTRAQGTNKIVEFGRTPPMSSYLVFVGVGPFERTPVAGLPVPGSIVTAPGKAALVQLIAQESPGILSALERYFGVPYPYPKLDQIAAQEFSGAMENAGAISYHDSTVLLDPDHVSFDQRRGMMETVTHEMAHMWFGDLVTMKWWDDVWLNEAFANWMSSKIASQLHPELRFEVSASQNGIEVRWLDTQPSVKPIRRLFGGGDNPREAFDGLTYRKGQAILRMVEGWLGPDKFRAALRQYFTRHRWGNARAEDLWAAFDQEAGGNISETLRGYIEQPGLPLVTLARLPGDRCEVRQRRYQTITAKAVSSQTWRVPIVIRYGGKGGERTARFLLAKQEDVFTAPGLDQADWLYPNASETGYYEWSLPPDLSAALTNRSLAPLTTAERLGLLRYAESALTSGQLEATQSLRLQLSLAADTEPEIRQWVAGSLASLNQLYLGVEDRSALAGLLHRALRPMLDQLGFEPKAGELPQIGPLRASLLATLGVDGDEPDVVAFCRKQAKLQLADPRSVDPGIADATLSVATWHGDASWLSALRQAFEQTQAPDVRARFLWALSGFRDPNLVRATLDYSLTQAMKPTEFPDMLFASFHAELAPVVFDWLVANYDAFKKKLPEAWLASLPGLLLSSSDAGLLAKGRAFFLDDARKTPLLEVRLTQVTEPVELMLALRARYQDSVRKLVHELGDEATR